jgi:hypothetical protein
MLNQLKRKLKRQKKAIPDEMLYKVFLRQKKFHSWSNVEFREKLRMFLSEHPYMIDEIELVEAKTPYWRTIQENYENPSPAQAKVRLKVAETASEHFGEKGLRTCKNVPMPLVCSHVQESFKDYVKVPRNYSKTMQERILKAKAKPEPTWEETMKELREALMGIAEVVEASR